MEKFNINNCDDVQKNQNGQITSLTWNKKAMNSATHLYVTAYTPLQYWDDNGLQLPSDCAIHQYNMTKYSNSPDTIVYGPYSSIKALIKKDFYDDQESYKDELSKIEVFNKVTQ